jgi:hypothetical protein
MGSFDEAGTATSARETVVDKFEPGASEVSNFDQTATKERMILHVRLDPRGTPSPPDTLPHGYPGLTQRPDPDCPGSGSYKSPIRTFEPLFAHR